MLRRSETIDNRKVTCTSPVESHTHFIFYNKNFTNQLDFCKWNYQSHHIITKILKKLQQTKLFDRVGKTFQI